MENTIKEQMKMATKYSRYIITRLVTPQENNPWASKYRAEDHITLLNLDKNVIEGLNCYARCVRFMPSMVEDNSQGRSTKPHFHTYDEVIGLIGTNPDDPHDLCGVSEITLGGEKHLITKSSLIYIPAGLEHGPFRELKMDRPIIQFECGNSGIHD
jgi:hypothetical protein